MVACMCVYTTEGSRKQQLHLPTIVIRYLPPTIQRVSAVVFYVSALDSVCDSSNFTLMRVLLKRLCFGHLICLLPVLEASDPLWNSLLSQWLWANETFHWLLKNW